MSFLDPPRRQRPSRYQALAQHEDDYASYKDSDFRRGSGNGNRGGYEGFAGLASAPQQRAPWDDPSQRTAWDTGAQDSTRGDFGTQRSPWDTGSQRTVRNGPMRDSTLLDSGPQRSSRATGGQPSTRSAGAHRAGSKTAARQAGQDLPRRVSGPFLALPEDDDVQRRYTRAGTGRRLLAGGLAGFLAAAVAIGVANLVAAFVRPQASPIIAVGGAFIDRTPSALKNFAVEKFGENDKNMLLLGMYVTIALIAIAIGVLAWRRLAIGVAGIGLFGVFGAFVAITRPESHVTDVIPSIAGGIAGIAALIWLVHAGMSRTRPAWARGR